VPFVPMDGTSNIARIAEAQAFVPMEGGGIVAETVVDLGYVYMENKRHLALTAAIHKIVCTGGTRLVAKTVPFMTE
jgi:hypothetical protein